MSRCMLALVFLLLASPLAAQEAKLVFRAGALEKDARIISDRMDKSRGFVARRIVDGVKRAHNLLRPAHIAFGSAQAPEHVFNRRWHMKPGSIPANPFGTIDKVKMNPPA